MPEAKPTEKAAEVKTNPKIAEAKSNEPTSLVTTVFAAAGGVPKNQVLQAAIKSVRDAIPVVYTLDAEITGAKKVDGGTEFQVTVSYTPREMAGDAVDKVDPDKVIKDLTVPTSVDGIHGVDGDPDFLDRKDDSGFPTK